MQSGRLIAQKGQQGHDCMRIETQCQVPRERGTGVNGTQAHSQKGGPGPKGGGLKISWDFTFSDLSEIHGGG